jgi:hypothetical protein
MDSENKKLRISVAQTDDSFIIMSKAIMAELLLAQPLLHIC